MREELPGPRPLSLKQNFSWTFLGNIVYAGCQWAMLVVLAKLGTAEMVGQFAMGLAVCGPVLTFSMLQMRAVQATDARGEFAFSHYLGFRLATTLVALVVIASIVLLAGYDSQKAMVVVLVGLAKSVESISDIFFGLFQQRECMDRIAKSMILKGILSLAGLTAAIALTGSLVAGTCALAATWALLLIGYDIPNAARLLGAGSDSFHRHRRIVRDALPRLSLRVAVRLTLLGWPLGLVMLLLSLKTNIPRYFVDNLLGERQLGIFAAMAYLMVAGTTIVSALGQSATPRLAKAFAFGNRRAFTGLVVKLAAVGTGLGLAGVLAVGVAGAPIMTLLYTQEYAQHTGALVWIAVAGGVLYVASFLGYALTAARYLWSQLPITIATVACSALLCALLVPKYGLAGGAAAMTCAALVQMIGSAILIAHVLVRDGKPSSVA